MHGATRFLRGYSLFPRLFIGNSSGNSSHKGSKRRSQQHQRRGAHSTAQSNTATGGVPVAQGGAWSRAVAVTAAIGSGLAFVLSRQQQLSGSEGNALAASNVTPPLQTEWAQGDTEEGAVKVLTAKALMAQEHPFLEDDHMFSAFVARGIIRDLEGWYHPRSRRFAVVVALGREVAGFPRVVHGGLTATIFDEAFGGLLFSLKKDGALRFWGPAYTVHLEVAYKAKITAGAQVLCAAEVESIEGRKLWMKATMSNGPEGKVYATARALFVAPKPQRLLTDVVQYLLRRAGEVLPGHNSGSSQLGVQTPA